jgi:hypothetical protein
VLGRGPVAILATVSIERCPYCRDVLHKPDLPVVACESCRTPFHRICLEELGRCTTLGCAMAELADERASPEELLLRALLEVQSRAAYGGGLSEWLAEVEHLSSLLEPAQVEAVRERARKVRSYEDLVEERARNAALFAEQARQRREAELADGELFAVATRRPLTRSERVLLALWTLFAIVLVVALARRS